MSVRVVVVVQARTGSSRLPGKVLMPLAGVPLLEQMIRRVAAASIPSEIIVATTREAEDDPIVELCNRYSWPVYRGHSTNLLDRHIGAAHEARAKADDLVVKIPSDCPLIDPRVIDRVLAVAVEGREMYDYVSNLHPATWPDGQDVEAMPLGVLEMAASEATRPMEREHTTPFIWERPDRFRLANVIWGHGLDTSMTHRWTIDYPEDYQFLARVYDELYRDGAEPFSVEQIMALVESRPEIAAINAHLAGVNWYRHHLGELRTVGASQTRTTTEDR